MRHARSSCVGKAVIARSVPRCNFLPILVALKQDRLIRVRKTRMNVDLLLPHTNPIVDLMFMDDSSNRLLSLMEPGYLLLWNVESLLECLGLNLIVAGHVSRSISSLQESSRLRLSLFRRPGYHGFPRRENTGGMAAGHGCTQGGAPENRLGVSG